MPHTAPQHDAIALAPGTAEPAVARSVATRILHLLLLVIVVHQLVNSQFIERPETGEPTPWLMTIHEYVGLASVAAVLAFWIWTVVRRGETSLGRLLPWFSPDRLSDVWTDLVAQARRLLRLQAPSDEDGALASAIHGLGLLVLTGMAVTGAVYFVADGTLVGRAFLTLHKMAANLMWAYLIGHAGLAVLHRILGSDIFSRMFWPARARSV
jgi:cytochrome b561